MNSPEHVPAITDVRFLGWDQVAPTIKQLTRLRALLREEGISAGELFGRGFTSLEDLSRWGASWGISYLASAQDARYENEARDRFERDRLEREEQRVKSMMAHILRTQRYA